MLLFWFSYLASRLFKWNYVWFAGIITEKTTSFAKHCSQTCGKMDKYSSATDARRLIHWLPIKARIEFEILSLVNKINALKVQLLNLKDSVGSQKAS